MLIVIHIGREFIAVFISTREATNSDGSTKNPTKSICDRYVFNTVITRAQSLVVAVGQPYYLFAIENRNSYKIKCWREYLKHCIISNNLGHRIVPNEKSFNAHKQVCWITNIYM